MRHRRPRWSRARARRRPRRSSSSRTSATLEPVGSFDLITCLDDSVNYLMDDGRPGGRLRARWRRISPPDGVLVFDVNTLSTYRTTFARDATMDGRRRVPRLARRLRRGRGAGLRGGRLSSRRSRPADAGLYERVTTRPHPAPPPAPRDRARTGRGRARRRRRVRAAPGRLARRRAPSEEPPPQARVLGPSESREEVRTHDAEEERQAAPAREVDHQGRLTIPIRQGLGAR